MEILISNEERVKVLQAVTELNKMEHVSYMSLQMLADTTKLKVTKVRLIVDDLVGQKLLTKYNVSDKQVRPRYYYVLTETGSTFLAAADNG